MIDTATPFQLSGTDGKTYVIANHSLGHDSALKFMRQVLYSKQFYYERPRNAKATDKRPHYAKAAVTPWTSSLGMMLPKLACFAFAYSPSFSFHPALTFFFEEYRKHAIMHLDDYGPNRIVMNGKTQIEIFDDFIAQMRKLALELKLKKKISDWESKHKKSIKSLLKFDAKAFKRCACLCAVRVNGHYHAATFTPEEIGKLHVDVNANERANWQKYMAGADLSVQEPIECRVTFEEVQRDRERLFANIKGKPSLFKHLVGAVWWYEYTPVAGYHANFVFLFDGSEVEEHERLAHLIGEYWANDITEGRGRFHNCNQLWNKSPEYFGLGMIDRHDAVKRKLLREHGLPCLSKGIQAIQITPHRGCNTFGSSFARQQKTKASGGSGCKRSIEDNHQVD